MSKYIKLEDAIRNLDDVVMNKAEYTDQMKVDLFHAIDDLPTIEVSEDCISRIAIRDELYRYNLDCDMEVEWHKGFATATKIVENAPSVVPSKGSDEE